MKRAIALASGVGLGAGLMYFFDPDRGARRQALVRDKLVAANRKTSEALGKAARDLNNRTAGIFAEVRGSLRREDVDDDVLVARVASRLGHVVSHPHAIALTADDGVVVLQGAILAEEVDRLVRAVRKVRGVRGVENELEVYDEPGSVSSLQGGRPRTGPRIDILQHNWAPATRALAGAAGGALLAYGIARRDTIGTGLGVAGALIAVRSLTNRELTDLAHVAEMREAVSSQVGRRVKAPIGLAARKLQSFVEAGAEAQRDELH